MKNAKVLIIDPGKFPEYRDVELRDDIITRDDDTGRILGYDSYEIAKELLQEYNKDNDLLVQRVKDVGSTFIGIYLDEEGRLKRLKANRNIILSTHEMISIAGRVIIIPDHYDSGCVVYADEEEFGKSAIEELKEFEERNHDNGSSPIVRLEQEECDKIRHEFHTFGDDEDDDFFEMLRRMFGR